MLEGVRKEGGRRDKDARRCLDDSVREEES